MFVDTIRFCVLYGCLERLVAKWPICNVGFKDLWLEDKDKDLRSKDKDKDFPQGLQHWVTVKNGLLADIISK